MFRLGMSMFRKLFVVPVMIAVLLITCQAAFAQDLVKVADNVYAFIAPSDGPADSYGANAGVVIGNNGIAVVDTLMSAKNATRFINDIRSISDKPIKYVINTHYHMDHTFGNAEFAKIGATIISQENARQNMEKYLPYELAHFQNFGLTQDEVEGTTIAYPTVTFQNKMGLDLGDQEIQLIYPGPSHTDGNILVYVPKAKVLFAADILVTDYYPMLGDADINEWVKALDFINTLNVTSIIPGHGPISTPKDVTDMKEFLLAFDQNAKKLCARSTDSDFIASTIQNLLPLRHHSALWIKPSIEIKYLKNSNSINVNE
ncbi:cyclase [Desulfocucumis palustris]|uniref:Cyclase n=1 Tax=Desulfocucumis palustris TaxID=1898651 RepID=A0A2L2XEZ4_9FIRM|nr:MBL fold metallo-hydrolase [Desulfocucumis palustris]GBF34805.1 cyclase [Desulfocucumis palustris]